ncbi:MAG TPA: B12-binding domain-containing radical SAM protein [Candidatus Binatia bacterium]
MTRLELTDRGRLFLSEAAGKIFPMNILMLYPKFPETFWNTARSVKLLWGCKGIMPPLGLLTIASYLPDDFSVRLHDRNIAEEPEADWAWADAVFVSAMVAQREDYSECIAAAKRHGKPIALGGPITHALPGKACADADWICFGEAENIIAELLSDLRADRRGKQYHGGSETNMEVVRVPRFELLPRINDYVTMALQFSRGCPFKCEFCDIIEIYGRVPRTKTPQQVCAELETLTRLGFSGYIFLVDDNFIGNKRKAKAMLSQLAVWNRAHGSPYRYYTEASINLADDDELMKGMFEAGFFHVFIGIETPDPRLLKITQKMQNVPGDPLRKIAAIREHGLLVTAGFIVGFDGEDRSVFELQKQFIQTSGIGIAMIGLLQAIPHTQLWRRLKSEGRLLEALNVNGNLTLEGVNFIPRGEMTKREYLARYGDLVRSVYDPAAYFARTVPALLALKAEGVSSRLGKDIWTVVRVILKEFYYFGVRSQDLRARFWKGFFKILWQNPAALEAFVFEVSVFHHLHSHAGYVARAVGAYLSSPDSADVLDQCIPDGILKPPVRKSSPEASAPGDSPHAAGGAPL